MPFRIFIANRNHSEKSLREEFGDIPVFDVTFAGRDPIFSTLSPMYPHGDLIVPFSRRELTACSLEAVWQGLKVFEREGAAFWWFKKSGDSGIKRVAGGSRGMVLGHQQGVYTDRPLLNVIEARSLIYAPLFKWQLKHHCEQALALIQEAHAKSDIVLLEAGNDSNIYDISTPLVHSALIRLFVLGEYPECGIGHVWTPLTQEEHLADIERRRRERAERIAAQKAKVHGSLGFFFDDESNAPQSAGKAERSPTSAVGTKSVPVADTTVAGDAISTPVGGQTSADSVTVPVPVPTAHTLAGTDSHSVSESANSADLVGTTSTLVTVATEETPVTAEAIGTADSVQTIVCKAPESPLPQTQSTTDLKAQDLLLSTDVATDKVVGEVATTSSTAEITAVVAEDTATPINAKALDLAVAVDVAEAVDAADTTEDKHSTAEAEHVSKSTDASSSIDAATESNPTTATTTATTATTDTTTSSAEHAKAVADTVDAILSPQSVTKTKPNTKRTRKTSGASTSRKRKAETKAATEADTQSLSLLSLIED